jgi:hypothetical protein
MFMLLLLFGLLLGISVLAVVSYVAGYDKGREVERKKFIGE